MWIFGELFRRENEERDEKEESLLIALMDSPYPSRELESKGNIDAEPSVTSSPSTEYIQMSLEPKEEYQTLKRFSDRQHHVEGSSRENEGTSRDAEGVQEVASSSPSSSSPTDTSTKSQYDVFLSFSGDTRKGFTGHLYDRLIDKGISTFIDSEELGKGETIEKLFEYVERSKVCVVVLSKSYADSKWSLREIAKMVEIHKTIVPVFLDVQPSDVRSQRGAIGCSLECHENNGKLKEGEVGEWRKALGELGNICGYSLQDTAGDEAKLIQVILKGLATLVTTPLLDVAEHPVGLESRLEDIKRILDIEVNDVRMIGIHGMGGIGKTTLAKAVYSKFSRYFDACSFISNVQETSKQYRGLESLQRQLLMDTLHDKNTSITDCFTETQMIKERIGCKKVLIVLDDVDDRKQLQALAGSLGWFKSGSRIIITTRDEKVLTAHEIKKDGIYAIERLTDDESMDLFCHYAFRKGLPLKEYSELSKEVVATAQGLPLALEVHGSQFFDMKNLQEWNDLLRKLKQCQNNEVHQRLRVSYDGLEDLQRRVFLDIACFFVGRKTEKPICMWESCGFHPRPAIRALLQKSLIKITHRYASSSSKDTRFEMHDQIRDMGRMIVVQERDSFPYIRSRVWGQAKDFQIHKLAWWVEGIMLTRGGNLAARQIEELPNQLRFLHLDRVDVCGEFKAFPMHLKWMKLRWCTFEKPPSDFSFKGSLVILDLNGTHSLANAFVEESLLRRKVSEPMQLKTLNLGSTEITTTPDFTNMPHLERLILRRCSRLKSVHESIGKLKKLVVMDLRQCWLISSLPNELGGLKSLEELSLNTTWLKTLPESITGLTRLRLLSLAFCENLETLAVRCDKVVLPSLCNKLKRLSLICKNLDKNYSLECKDLETASISCENLERLRLECRKLDTISLRCKNLEKLTLNCENLTNLSDSLHYMGRLKELELSCDNLEALVPGSTGPLVRIEKLSLGSWEGLTVLPSWLCRLTCMKQIMLSGFPMLTSLPDDHLPHSSLSVLRVSQCIKLDKMPNVANWASLVELSLDRLPNLISLPPHLPSSLCVLRVSHCISLVLISNVANLTALTELRLGGCRLLKDVHGIEKIAKNLRHLELPGPEGPLGCSNLTDDFKKAFWESEFERLWTFKIEGTPASGSSADRNNLQCMSFNLPKRHLFERLDGCDFIPRIGLRLRMKIGMVSKNTVEMAVLADGIKVLETVREAWYDNIWLEAAGLRDDETFSELKETWIDFEGDDEMILCLIERRMDCLALKVTMDVLIQPTDVALTMEWQPAR